MASPSEKLAESLEVLHELQERGGVAIRSGDLTRTHRERLVKSRFLQKVIKGWYVPARPGEAPGESTAWYALFWSFCAAYRHCLGVKYAAPKYRRYLNLNLYAIWCTKNEFVNCLLCRRGAFCDPNPFHDRLNALTDTSERLINLGQ